MENRMNFQTSVELPAGMPSVSHADHILLMKAGEGVIPADVFRDAVDQLHHPPGRPLRPPPCGGNCVDPIAGGKGKFLFDHHGNPAPFVIE